MCITVSRFSLLLTTYNHYSLYPQPHHNHEGILTAREMRMQMRMRIAKRCGLWVTKADWCTVARRVWERYQVNKAHLMHICTYPCLHSCFSPDQITSTLMMQMGMLTDVQLRHNGIKRLRHVHVKSLALMVSLKRLDLSHNGSRQSTRQSIRNEPFFCFPKCTMK